MSRTIKKGRKLVAKIWMKVLGIVSILALIFIATLMLGKTLPTWSSIAFTVTGWVLLVVGIVSLIAWVIDLILDIFD